MNKYLALAGCLLAVNISPAQESPDYKITDYVLATGAAHVLSSDDYKISGSVAGEVVSATGLASPQYGMDGGFGSSYPPPGEVFGVRFTDVETLVWNPENSVGDYNLYRGLISDLSFLGYGACEEYDIAVATTTDPDDPPLGDGYFYLVTAENRLAEEGITGFDSSESERPNPDPCP